MAAASADATPFRAEMLIGVFALLVAQVAAESHAVEYPCGEKGFQCRDGECILAARRCDGAWECGDGSDEEGCEAVPTLALSVNATVTVRLQYAEEHTAIDIQLCGSEHCSRMWLWGESYNGSQPYTTYTGCNLLGKWCIFDKVKGEHFSFFSSGEVVLEVQRRPGHLAVWRKERPEDVAVLPVEADYGTLKIRPYAWSTDMPVQFTRDAACGYRNFTCGDGECIDANRKCNGKADCTNGSDEFATMCDEAPSVRMRVGDSVTVRVQYNVEHGHVWFHLCDASSCSTLVVGGSNAFGWLGHHAFTGNNARGDFGTEEKHGESLPDGYKEFPEGPLIFLAERRSSELAVWLQGHEDQPITVPVTEGSDLLRVRPYYWSSDMPVKFHQLPTKALAPNATVTARVQNLWDHNGIELHLCGGDHCSVVWLLGESRNGTLPYTTFTGCNFQGRDCSHNTEHGKYVRDFTGEVVLEVQRLPGTLAVWRQERPDDVVAVPVEADYGTLRIRPHHWSSDMPVQFTVTMENTCGKAEPGPLELVVGGDPAAAETVPWHAAIYVERSGRKTYSCGGTLVASCFVVTAAHCVPREMKLFVALGKYLSAWDSKDEPNTIKTKVKSSHMHELYAGYNYKHGNDIAVLELETCVDPSDKVLPICLDAEIKPSSGSIIKVAGWGNETTTLVQLDYVTLSQLDNKDCFDFMKSNPAQLQFVTNDKFCARRRKSSPFSGLKQGDSGGGALAKRGGLWFLAGIVSVRLRDGQMEDVYALTDVSQHVLWIKRLAGL